VGANVLGFGVGTEGITDGATVGFEGINVGDSVGKISRYIKLIPWPMLIPFR